MTEASGLSKAAKVTFDLPGYSDIRQIGAGGMAIVYLATQQSFNRKVAIKVLMPAYTADKEFAERFLREAKIVSSLSHPHIIPVYDFGQRNDTFYIVMEYLKDGDLAKRIQSGLSEEQILQITSDIASALHFAHEKGFIHRDVKPDNVMFREDGSAVLTDFGIARQQNANTQMTKAGQTVGTPRYMSPQQLQGRGVDGRADLYSLGIMFYEMFTKQTPYQDEDFMALAMKHLQAPIPRLPEKFSRYQKFFERMVAKDPDKRFQKGKEIVDIIQQIRSGKVDAASIDSGAAAELKKVALGAAEKKIGTATAAPVTKRVRLPRDQMVVLQDMDPVLDGNWSRTVGGIFSKLTPPERKYVYEQFLQPKGIFLDPKTKQFAFKGRLSVQEAAAEVITNPELQTIATKVMKSEQMIRTTRDINALSDIIESSLSIIDRFDTQDNLASQKQKLVLRAALLDDLVKLIREATFELPQTRRFLTVDIIKAFIIQVYLRHEMMGYRFRTLSASMLEDDPDAFVSGFIASEARIRQCDAVRSENCLFLIGPVRDANQNPYSIRRFLKEDTAMGGQVVYFNAVAIPLDQLADPKIQEGVRWIVSRIVTLERQLSPVVMDLVRGMEKSHKEQLVPTLIKPIDADGTEIEKAIQKRMADYERKLSLMILGKIPKGLTELAKTNDDFEYLFFNLRRLLIDMACDVRDFAAQTSAAWSYKAEEMDLRMMSYLKLMDKRKSTLFISDRPKEVDPTMDPDFPLTEFKKIVAEHEESVKGLNTKLRELILAESEPPKSGFMVWLKNLFGSEKNKVTAEDVQNQITAVKQKCLVMLIRAKKRYPTITVYLEFDDIIPVDEHVRHYALPMGTDGIARLPMLVALPEDPASFEMTAVRKTLEDDAFAK